MNRKNITLLVLAVAFTGGCSLHRPGEIRLVESPPETWLQQKEGSTNQPIVDEWWLVFKDDTLNTVMNQAFANNLSLAQAYSRIEQFEAVASQSKASRLPQISLKGSKSRAQSIGFQGLSTGESYNFSLAASFEVDLWGKLKARQKARLLDLEASRQDIQTLYLSLSAQIAENYFYLLERNEQLEFAKRTLQARQSTFELVQSRYQEGLVTALDVYQAQQAMSGAEARIPQLERDVAVIAHGLSVLLGQYPNMALTADTAPLPEVKETLKEWFPAGLPSDMLKNRPDIRGELNRLYASDLEIGIAIADRFPSINLMGEYGKSGFDYGTSLSGTVWNILANLAMPVLDWGGRKAEVERKKAVFNEKLDHYRETVLIAFREVEDALISQEKTSEMIQFMEDESHAAEAALELSMDQYRDGVSNYLPVLTAQVFYFDSQTRLLAARRQLISNSISLMRALGGQWMAKYAEKPGSGQPFQGQEGLNK